MRVYTYDPEVWGQGGIRLAASKYVHVEPVDDPGRADVFVVPQTLAFLADRGDNDANARRFLELPHLEGNEDRHVVVDIAEHCPPPPVPGVRYFRCGDVSEELVEQYPSTIPWPWPVDDLIDVMPLVNTSEGCTAFARGTKEGPRFTWDVGYIGYDTPLDLTPRAVASCERHAGLVCRFERHAEAWGWARIHDHPDPAYRAQTDARRTSFVETLRGSRVTLEAVAKRGTWRYRFFESWSAGRIPVHIGDGCARPWGDRIPYDDLAIFVAEAEVDRTGDIVRRWLDRHSDVDILAWGEAARRFYDRWLHKDRWPELMAEAVSEVVA